MMNAPFPPPARHGLIAEHALARVAGSDARTGNAVEILRDAEENYPAWLDAIASARRCIHFENFIIANDATGRRFAAALAAKAREGVTVRLLYDWLGCTFRAGPSFWRDLRRAGVDVRVFNPPSLAAPDWIKRNHRKVITVDGRIGFVAGLCVADCWIGDAKRGLEPWRDTGVVIRGPAVADLDQAFAATWALCGPPLPFDEVAPAGSIPPAGDLTVRVLGGRPGVMGTFRLDLLVAAAARQRLWLTDAYFLATPSYTRALVEAARDGVDVRLLVPGTSDVPLLPALVRAGYRPLLEAGVRVFEWNGSMIHAKTAVADGIWSRVGSTNLNLTSWMTNWELDVTVEDEGFAGQMEAMFVADLARATEIVPERASSRRASAVSARQRRSAAPPRRRLVRLAGSATGAMVGGARAFSDVETRSQAVLAGLLLAFAALVTAFPVIVVSPLVITAVWIALALLWRVVADWRSRRHARRLRAHGRPAGDRAPGAVHAPGE